MAKGYTKGKGGGSGGGGVSGGTPPAPDRRSIVVPEFTPVATREMTGGTEKQVAWAESIRSQMIRDAPAALKRFEIEARSAFDEGTMSHDKSVKVIGLAVDAYQRIRHANNAKWFIDNRNRSAYSIMLSLVKDQLKKSGG